MAAIEKKRKNAPTNDSFARTRNPSDKDNRPSKRIRPDEDRKPVAGPTKISHERDEEVAFPRGGASILTPLEHKQIQIEATQDVLFEQNAKADGEGDAVTSARKKSKSKAKGKKPNEQAEEEEESVKIEGLSYKRIVPGSLVLGQISQINDHDIALSLPNNLTGYVPITSISDKVTQRIEKIAAAENNHDEEDEIELEKLFWKGQYLRAYVVSTSDDTTSTSGKSKRRIELSLRPQQSNNALASQNIITNSMLMASVASVEDHGLVMDVGTNDNTVRGFMSSKEIGHDLDISAVQEGSVFLCMVTGLSSNGKIIKLSADTHKIANLKKLNYLTEAPTVDAFLPGTAVEILVADITPRGLAGKVMGMVDVTADLIHSGAGSSGKDLEKKYKLGSKIRGRIICTFPSSDPPKLGISLLDHVMALAPQQAIKDGEKQAPLVTLPSSTIVEEVTVRKVESGLGLFVDVGVKGVSGFVHISRVKDGKIETLSETSGPYKTDSVHRGRVIGYNALDGEYLMSLEPSVLEQPFLQIEDLKIGEVVKGKVEKIVLNAAGVGGVLVNLAEGITGLVPETHMADVQLLHPEKKFKEGMAVTARVLSTDASKRQIRLTLKKTLVNSESQPFLKYEDIDVGMQSPGTIVNILPTGAVVQFYGTVRGFLPVAEMSEAYIQDPKLHFRVGQVVNVHVLKVNPEAGKLTVSCKDPSVFGLAQQTALKKLKVGDIVSGVVTEKSSDDISLEIEGLGLHATLPAVQLTDKSSSKNLSALKKIRVGQTLKDLAVLEKLDSKRLVVLTNKPSLVKAAKERTLLRGFDDVRENKVVHGFVKNTIATAVFVQFGGGLTGLLPKNKLPEEATELPDFGLKKYQSVKVKVTSVDHSDKRFLLSMINLDADQMISQKLADQEDAASQEVSNPIDDTVTSLGDLKLGRLTKARVVSVKDTQINVQLADNIQGRIDVSQVFDSWDEIKDRKRPLKRFSAKQIIDVRIMGTHDARNHRFLPITHRTGKSLVFELSAKRSDQTGSLQDPLTLDKVKIGSSWTAFVNNVSENCLWVNLSPNVRGRINAFDVSDNLSLMEDLEGNFPVGSAIKVRATNIDVANNRLDLSGRSTQSSEPLSFQTLSNGMVVPGKVVKVSERYVVVHLSDTISGSITLTDLADDFSQADTTKYSKNSIVRVCIVDVDVPNKKVRLSTRPSKVLNSSLNVQDPEISSISDVKVGDVVRGFVKNVSDKGLFVNLGGNVSAYVRVSDISDSYIKDWKSEFQVDQLVKGKITTIDPSMNHIKMSMKASVIDKNYVPPITFKDLKKGQIITGKIASVQDFGVFIVVDGSNNLRGLCHQSEMAEKRVHDVKKLYDEGDLVKAIILKLDDDKERISLGMKASYFGEDAAESEDDSDSDGMNGVQIGGSDEDVDMSSEEEDENGGVDLDDVESIEDLEVQDDLSDVAMGGLEAGAGIPALNAGGFDWSAKALDKVDKRANEDSEDEDADDTPKKKKRRKATITIDRTGDLDANGPQSVSDFERLLLGQPDSSQLWIEYMAFQMQLSELSKARDVAERAIKTITISDDKEKMNVWIALLNLENAYGSDETLEEAFKRACQYNDAQDIHESLASIYIQSGKHGKADELFQTLVKKFSQSPRVWKNYADFLYNTLSAPDRARALLPRATQSLPSHEHLRLTLVFAHLEFNSASGSPERGRTMFEGVLSTFPKRLDIWRQLLDLETKQGDQDIIRGVFERVVKTKGLKPKGAKDWFKRWSEWEEKNGDKKTQEKVKAKAEEWVRTAAQKKANDGEDVE
ncbi:rRNA biogenesis protein [Lachnellula hyalina]|uniref:rRNA biogenesis protein RRP5 n=1 Tax=Lachnellula hyalina TaxID=1316788 RepID=A0A8H8QY02_9HELO|nr:rRNA biogenesis protein [Lachnellula hyalina]TVY24932.1 rRNA biogenesis protein [Lachnellula hyalina]